MHYIKASDVTQTAPFSWGESARRLLMHAHFWFKTAVSVHLIFKEVPIQKQAERFFLRKEVNIEI